MHHDSSRPTRIDPLILGTLCGLVSAVGYTAANIFLRSVTDCDPIWVSCMKALPTVLLVGPYLLLKASQGRGIVTSPKMLGWLLAAGLLGQLAGNVAFQWSLGEVGIALAVPLCSGAMIISGVVLGRYLLGESVTWQTMIAGAVLIASICVLSLGAADAHQSVAGAHKPLAAAISERWLLAAGVTAACLSGVAYCVLGAVIRATTRRGMPPSTVLFAVGLVGVIGLGAMSLGRTGMAALADTDSADLAMMLAAGVCNAVAFAALTKALQLTGVVFVNALNASQTAMAAIAGVMLFGEPTTVPLLLGVALSILGLFMMRRRSPRRGEPDVAPQPLLTKPSENGHPQTDVDHREALREESR